MNAKVCTCENCQKHAPLYPYYIRPMPRDYGPRLVLQFHETDDQAMQEAVKWSPVYEWRMMTHDQVNQMYAGRPITV